MKRLYETFALDLLMDTKSLNWQAVDDLTARILERKVKNRRKRKAGKRVKNMLSKRQIEILFRYWKWITVLYAPSDRFKTEKRGEVPSYYEIPAIYECSRWSTEVKALMVMDLIRGDGVSAEEYIKIQQAEDKRLWREFWRRYEEVTHEEEREMMENFRQFVASMENF